MNVFVSWFGWASPTAWFPVGSGLVSGLSFYKSLLPTSNFGETIFVGTNECVAILDSCLQLPSCELWLLGPQKTASSSIHSSFPSAIGTAGATW